MTTVYTAEQSSGDVFMIASWPGLNESDFFGLVLERLAKEGIPNPDIKVFDLDLCSWSLDDFSAWVSGGTPTKGETWATMFRAAKYDHLEWGYPGVWTRDAVKSMPPELAAEFDPRDDPELDERQDWETDLGAMRIELEDEGSR